MLEVGDIVTNGHVHDDNGTKMRARIIAIDNGEAWVLSLTGPHEGGRLTFDVEALSKMENGHA